MLKSTASPYYPLIEDKHKHLLYPQAKFVGVPVSKGQRKYGTQFGPQLIRDSNYFSKLEEHGIKLKDEGDVDIVDIEPSIDLPRFNMIQPTTFIKNTLKIAEKVENLIKTPVGENANCPLIICGGDHSLATGSILGHMKVKPEACVIWIDAHADLNKPLTSSSGNIHGMPLSFLMHELQDEIPWIADMASIKPCLSAKNLVYIGLRDVDFHETYDIRKNNIAHFTMLDVDQLGINNVIKQALQIVNPRLDKPIHLSFDIDALDPIEAPSTGTAVPGGLSLREGIRICEEVAATGKLSLVELVELNPKIGTTEDVKKTQDAATYLLSAAIGICRSGHLPSQIYRLADQGNLSRQAYWNKQKQQH